MRNSPILAASVLAIALGAASSGANAGNPDGFYVGAGAGQSMIDEDFADDEDFAYQVFGGYQFNRYLGAEAAYTDFGKVDLADNVGELEADTWSLVLVGTVPFTEKFSGYVKAGFHDWDAELGVPDIGFADDSGTDPTYGLGLQYRFTDNVSLRGEYSRFEMDDVDVDLAQLQVRFDF